MKLISIILALAVLLSSATAAFSPKGINLDKVTIYGVSTSIKELSYQPKGSRAGGTTIYITCSGHNMISTENKVMVGPYECNIPEKGVTATTISCVTTEAHDEKRLNDLPVELFVNGKQQNVCKGRCVFSYKHDATPAMRFIQPSASAPNRDINWNGIFRVSNTIDIKKMIIGNDKNGDFNCNRFQLRDVKPGQKINLNDDEAINARAWTNVPCTVAKEQVAGFYDIRQENRWGHPVELSSMNHVTNDGKTEYQFVVTPEITSVSQNAAGSKGTILKIEGKGFGYLKDEVEVSAGGLACEIQSVQNNEIICKVAEGTTPAVDSSTPGQFIKGQGATLSLHNWHSNAKALAASVRAGTAELYQNRQPEQVGSWEVAALDDSVGASIVGYFYAPRTGAYNFWATGDDSVAVYINTTPMTPSCTEDDLIVDVCSWKQTRSYFNPANSCQFRSEDVQLTEGNYYWLEAYVQNGGGLGHMTVSVETPSIPTVTPKNVVPNIVKYSLVPEKQTQEWSVKVWGNETPYGLKFYYRNPDNFEVLWDRTTEEFKWADWTLSHFKNQVKWAAGGFDPQVEEFALNAKGKRCQDDSNCDIQGKEFVINFNGYRAPVQKNQAPKFSSNIPSSNASIEKTQEQYAKLSGHYTIDYNSEPLEVFVNNEWTTNIPYNANSGTIREAFFRKTGANSISVEASGNADTGYTFVISFLSEDGSLNGNQTLEFESFLVGEKPGSSPQIQQTEVVSAQGGRLFYEPITFDFMFQPSDLPSIIVNVEGIPSAVAPKADNSFQATDENTPEVTSYSVSGSNLNLVISQGDIAFENDQVEVMYGYSKCENYNGSSCSFVQDLEGGDHQPTVYVKNVGYIKFDPSFPIPSNPVRVVVSTVSPNTGSINGGQYITLSGSGFSASTDRATVKFANEEAEIYTISTSEIVVVLPAVQGAYDTAKTITVEINGTQNTSKSFTYSDQGVPTISQLNPPQASPVQKGSITITGTNFGTNEDDIRVELFNDQGEVAYNLFLQTVTDTEIVATLSGGKVGDYKLRVFKNGKGYSVQEIQFSYKILISNVQPRKGSLLGGTVLTITGQNFSSTLSDNLVFLTQADEIVNDVCTILTATNTEITCVTPPKNEAFDEAEPILIYVMGRLVEESVCASGGVCDYNYSSSKTPSLTEQSEALLASGSTISVTGTGFISGNVAKLQITPELTVTGSAVSTTELQFDTPQNIAAGEYGALVSVEGLGYAGIFQLKFEVEITDVQPTTLSLIGGIITVTGKHFDDNAYLTVGTNYKPGQVISQTNTEIKFLAPPKIKNNWELHLEQGGVESVKTTYQGALLEYKNRGSVNFANPDQKSYVSGSIQIDLQNTDVLDADGAVVTPKLFKQGNLQKQYTGSYSSQQISFSGVDVPAGSYILYIELQGSGFIQISNIDGDFVEIEVTQSLTLSQINTGLFGGNSIQISGAGFDTENYLNNDVRVCGYACKVSEANTNNSQLECQLPVVNTEYLKPKNQQYPVDNFVLVNEDTVEKEEVNGIPVTMIADNVNSENFNVLKESGVLDQYVSNGEEGCYVGYNFGEYLRIDLQSVVITTDVTDLAEVSKLYGAKLQVSNDLQNWTDILEFSNSNLKAYTYINKFDIDVPQSQYIRFFNEESSYCGITGFNLTGFNYYKQQIADNSQYTCDVSVNVNGQSQVLSQKVTYSNANSSTVDSFSPYYGWQLGGTSVTITGEGFGNNSSVVSVYFDDIECVISSVSNTEIVCTTGDKGADNYAAPKVAISVNGINSIIPEGLFFYYGLLWSEDASWGLEAAPRAGDSVFVAKGRTLIIDENTPVLDTVINQGRVVFADDGDLKFACKYFINQKSELIIGTEFSTYQSNLTITLHGTSKDKQLPQFGVKVIACQKCTLDIHGLEKSPRWTFIETTVNPGDSTLTTKQQTNWKVGDRLALATTDFDGRHSEEVFITQITHNQSGDTIKFTPELKYTHISVSESYGDKTLNMWAEVGNLSRNILIQGNPEDNELELYGGHVLMHGEGAVARIENVEFTRTGQAMIIGRYTMHFHMVGDCSKSYIRGNAVHNAFARVVALHDIRNLRVEENVSYWVRAHNIFLENGIETDNQIHRNLIISPRSAFKMLQTDITVAGIWITNPTNYVTFNHVAGSEFYGLWYEIFERPESPNTANDVCPEGNPLGETDHNVSHSNERFGLRIFRLAPRKFPCQPLNDPTSEDPWAANPSIEQIYTNHTLWKNGDAGLLAEEMGNAKFQDFILADNYYAGFQAQEAGFTKEELILEDSIIIGQTEYTQNNLSQEELDELNSAGQNSIVAPRKDGCRVRNVKIYNFLAGSYIITMASQNDNQDLGVSGGKQFNIENVQFFNSDAAKKVQWVGMRYNIIFDVDGTFSGKNAPTYIAPYYNAYDQPIADGKCDYNDQIAEKYQNAVLCDGVRLRSIPIGSIKGTGTFVEQTMKVLNLNDKQKAATFGTEQEVPENFSIYKQGRILSGDNASDYEFTYAEGYAYNLHWNSKLDWSHIQVYPSEYAENDDKTIILRFNYTEQRELFDVFRRDGKQLSEQYEQIFDKSQFYDSNGLPNSSDDGCKLGQFFVESEEQTVSLCINNKGRTNKKQQVDMNGIYCRHSCPKIEYTCEKEVNYRLFTEESQWKEANGNLPLRKRPEEEDYTYGVPQKGDDVIIPCPWTVVLNVNEFEFGTLTIDGTLLIDEGIDHTKIKANNIWVRSGKIVAGTEDYPFDQKLDITLTGNEYTPPLVIDDKSKTGTKSMAVTGRLELFGEVPAVTQTRLAKNANIGENQILVEAETDSWKVGDELVLGGSQLDGQGYEKVKISAINEKQVTLERPLEFFHYGAEKPSIGNDDSAYVQIDAKYGTGLDMRTVVGHLSRNIRIMGAEEGNLGGHLQVYYWYVQEKNEFETIDIDLRGSIALSGVEMKNMGQQNTDNAGIHILHTSGGEQTDLSVVKGSSISDCVGICVNLLDTRGTRLDNNVIYHGQQYLIQNLGFKDTQITNNLFVAVEANIYTTIQTPDTFIYMYSNYNPATDAVKVTGNVGQSSNGAGYVFPATPCEQRDQNSFTGNEAGRAKEVGFIYTFNRSACLIGGYNHAYHCTEGTSAHSAGTTEIGWSLENQILVENGTGVVMRSGSKNDYLHHNYLKNTYISGLVLSEICPECYTSNFNGKYFRCSNQLGALMLLTNLVGNAPPLDLLGGLGLKALCNSPVISSQVFITDCEFANFRSDYSTDALFHNLQEEGVCGTDNKVFKTNTNASEATAAHYLRNTKCTNCDKDVKFYLHEPKEDERGWFGGCGIMDCTGMENVMVQDMTGQFLGVVGTAISNNEDVGYGKREENQEMENSCEYVPAWNGFLCERDDFAQLQWEAIGPDAQEIDTAPVTLSNDYFENSINMWKEWEWIGPEPQNMRQNSFVSLALANQRHQIAYSGTQSMDIVHRLSHRSAEGEQNRYTILESTYKNPLTIEVLVNGQIISPFSFKYPEDLGLHTAECGKNNYYYKNNTIHFVVTNVPSCLVEVRQVNHVQINARISLTEEEFLGDDTAETKFVDRITAFLGIPFDRVRIVGIVTKNRRLLQDSEEVTGEKEVELQFIIKGNPPGTPKTNYDGSADFQELNKLGKELVEGIENDKVEEMLSAEYQVVVVKQAGVAGDEGDYFTEKDLIKKSNTQMEEKEEGGNGVAIALGVIFGLLAVIVIILISYHFYTKRSLKVIKNLQVDNLNDDVKPAVKEAQPGLQQQQSSNVDE